MTQMRNKIVILEDNDERQQQMLARLRDRLPPCPVVFFKSAHEMLKILPQHLPGTRVISLDNDLERTDEDCDPGAGRDVARYLAAIPPACPVIIHSTNTHAAVAMEAELQDAGWQVQRVTPYEDLAWVDREWFWAVREALLVHAKTEANSGGPESISADTLLAAQEFIARAGGVAQAKAAFDHLAGSLEIPLQ